ncbi:MAG: glycosyltransferase family 9 protein [Endomicrobiia bacterium]
MKKILIRGPDTIGSFILATPFYRELRNNLPNDYIALCVKPLVYDLAKNCPYVDKVILYEKNILRNLNNIKNEKFDEAYLLSGSFESALVSFLAGIKERIGYPHDHRGIFLTKKIVDLNTQHYIDYTLHILESVGFLIKNKEPEIYIKDYNSGIFAKYKNFFESNSKVVGITYTSIANDARKWPVEYVIDLSYKLIEKGYKVILLGKNQSHLGLKIENENFLDLINKTTIFDFIYLLRNLSTYISVATGGIHIAAVLGIKVIALYIPGDERWLPYGRNVYVIVKQVGCAPCNQHKMKYCRNNICLKTITPEEVLEIVLKTDLDLE